MIKTEFYFKVLTKRNRNINKLKSFKTVKLLHKLQGANIPCKTNGNNIHLHSIPKPKILYKITHQKNNNVDDKAVEDSFKYVLKPLYGINIKYIAFKKSQIIRKCAEIHPIELQSILYRFAMAHIDDMNMEQLAQFQQLLQLGLDSNDDPLLLLYLSANLEPPKDMIANNDTFVKLLKFVSNNHPYLSLISRIPHGKNLQ